jgi:hypothetical protein
VISALQRRQPAGQADAGRWRPVAGALSRHWLICLLLAAGLAARLLTQLAYRPALFYIDSTRYLYHATGNDPVGYRVPLRAILLAGNLDLVAVVQHLAGLAMASAIYVVLVRRGAARWLAALAAAPVLLDGYQLQIEQTIMPDVWFEALIVAGLTLLLWQPRPRLPLVAGGGLALGGAVTIRQVGEILILPALACVLAATGWRRAAIGRGVVLCGAFAVPVLAYCTVSLALTGHFWLSHSGTTTVYGRVAEAADCAAMKLPASQRALCPDARQKQLGPDGLEHAASSPLRPYYADLPHSQASRTVSSFNEAVLAQQPGRVLVSWLSDSAKLFAARRVTSPGDTPIWRWQFQGDYPVYPPHASRAAIASAVADFGGGQPAVDKPLALFLRHYQLHGGYTPGPAYLFMALAGLIGSLGLALRRRAPQQRQLAIACLLFFTTAASVLLVADLFEFSWRYQLPALVTLPPAGALGVAVVIAEIRRRRGGAAGTSTAGTSTAGTSATEGSPTGTGAAG